MKKKIIVGLIAMVVIVLTVMFSGCVEEETLVSTPTATPTYTSEPTTHPTIKPK